MPVGVSDDEDDDDGVVAVAIAERLEDVESSVVGKVHFGSSARSICMFVSNSNGAHVFSVHENVGSSSVGFSPLTILVSHLNIVSLPLYPALHDNEH